jgi:uncharacterized protein
MTSSTTPAAGVPCREPTKARKVLGLFGKMMELSGGTFQVEVQDILANGKHGVALTIKRGQRTGRTLESRSVHVWDIRDGKCTRFRAYNEEAWDEFWS